MAELDQLAQLARSAIDPAWDARESERALRGMLRKRTIRRVRNGVASAATVVGLVWVGFSAGRLQPSSRVEPRPVELAAVPGAPAGPSAAMHLRDGSVVRVLRPDTELRLIEDSDRASRVELLQGAARFFVEPRHGREFLVSSRQVMVSVVGTVFVLEQLGDEVEVRVESGLVRVRRQGEEWLLQAGEGRRIPPAPPVVSDPAPPPPPKKAARRDGLKVEPATEAWRTYVHEGAYDKAYEALQAAKPRHLNDSAKLLMEAADAARYSGHPQEAVGYLREVLQHHGGDALAPLAAFTLGRLQLEQLRAPLAAAKDFAEAYRLTSNDSLAQDALAREVEAWVRVGDMTSARERAALYVRRFPEGPRAATVRALAGLE